MASHEASVDVKVPLPEVYEAWTDYASYPKFLEDVREVRPLDDGRIQWHAELGSRLREWESETIEEEDDGHVAWRSLTGAVYDGDVWLTSNADDHTTVRLRLEYDPDGVIEGAAAAKKAVHSYVEGGIRAFKRYIEERHAGRQEAMRAASKRSRDTG
jgi:uncharacterized membrane protein